MKANSLHLVLNSGIVIEKGQFESKERICFLDNNIMS